MNTTHTSIAEAVQRIATSPAPVLFPDTCAILDLLRIPLQEDSIKGNVEIAKQFIALSQLSPCALWIVIPSQVFDEWNGRVHCVLKELENRLQDIDKQIEKLHEVADAVELTLPARILYSRQHIVRALKTLSEDFLKGSLFVSLDPACKNRAVDRTMNNRPPARKGQLSDCIIIEHCIELCSKLLASGFSEERVFFTLNSKDYFEGKTSKPKDPLDSELMSVGLSLTKSWQWTKAELGLR